MRKIGSSKAKNDGKAVAKLVPAGRGFDRKKAMRAAAGLREASNGVMLRGLKIKDLINLGRP
jgi:hypothetical protein